MCQICGKNDFFLVVVEKNKLDIIYQREKRFQKIVNYFRNSIVIKKYVLKKFTIFFLQKKIFLLFFGCKTHRATKQIILFFYIQMVRTNGCHPQNSSGQNETLLCFGGIGYAKCYRFIKFIIN